MKRSVVLFMGTLDREQLKFIVWNLEAFKSKWRMSGKEVYDLFEEHGVFDVLREHDDALRQTGQNVYMAAVMTDIQVKHLTDYLKNRGVTLHQPGKHDRKTAPLPYG